MGIPYSIATATNLTPLPVTVPKLKPVSNLPTYNHNPTNLQNRPQFAMIYTVD